jgi:hypothetical protein
VADRVILPERGGNVLVLLTRLSGHCVRIEHPIPAV